MSVSGAARKQGELEGLRPKRLATLESLVRDLMEAKDELKKQKEVVDERAEAVLAELKSQDETTYGWRENGKLITVSRRDREAVSITISDPKKGKGRRTEEGASDKGPIGFGRR